MLNFNAGNVTFGGCHEPATKRCDYSVFFYYAYKSGHDFSMTIEVPLAIVCPFAVNSFLIDGAADAIGSIFTAQKSGTLDRFFFGVRNALSTPSYLVRIETLSAGRPGNSIIATGASATVTPSGAGTVNIASMTTPYAITKGDMVAVTIQYSSGTIGASNYTEFPYAAMSYPGPSYAQTGERYLAAVTAHPTWGNGLASAAYAGFGAVYDDNEILGQAIPLADAIISTNIPTSGTDSWYGSTFTAPINCECIGWVGCGRFDGTCSITLYDSSNNSLASQSIVAGSYPAAANINGKGYFSSSVKLQQGQRYRLFGRLTSGTMSIMSYRCDLATLTNPSLYHDLQATTSSNGIAWTNNTNRFAAMIPVVKFSNGVRIPNIRGGADQ